MYHDIVRDFVRCFEKCNLVSKNIVRVINNQKSWKKTCVTLHLTRASAVKLMTKVQFLYTYKVGARWVNLVMLACNIGPLCGESTGGHPYKGSVRSSSILHHCSDVTWHLKSPPTQMFPWTKWPPFWRTTSSNAFSWMKSFVFWFEFHWSLFLRVQLTINEHWFW